MLYSSEGIKFKNDLPFELFLLNLDLELKTIPIFSEHL